MRSLSGPVEAKKHRVIAGDAGYGDSFIAMFWYLIILTVVLFFGLIAREGGLKGQDWSKTAVLGCCAVLLFFAVLRDSEIGADTDSYESLFLWVRSFDISELGDATSSYWFFADSDYLYRIYNSIIGWFTDNPRAITVLNSLIIICLLAVMSIKQSSDPWLSVLMYVCLGLYQLGLNLAPSFMASLIVLCAVPFAKERRLVPFLACVLCGAIFHPAALVMAIIYPLTQIRLTAKRFWSLTLIGIALASVGYRFVLSVLTPFLPAQYLMYLGGEELNIEKLAVWIMQFVIFLIAYLFHKNRDRLFEEQRPALWIFLIETVLYFFVMQSSGLNRAAFLFMPYMIILIPNMLNQSFRRSSTRGISSLEGAGQLLTVRHCNLVKLLIIAVCVVGYVARMSINNIGMTMPYEFCF